MKGLLVLLLLNLGDPWGPFGTWGVPRTPSVWPLYPFGAGAGDRTTPREDDGRSPEIHLDETFTFYGRRHRTLYVNNNGVVSFGTAVPEFTPEPFPLPGHSPLVAPFWADVDNTLGGDIFYRQSRDPQLLDLLARDLAVAVEAQEPPPKPTWAFVATWDRVPYFGSASKKVNTFQAVLATEGPRSFVMFNYGALEWSTGIANHGDPHTGRGGLPAQVGFNSGDDTHFFTVPGSRSPAVLGVARGSNVAHPGRWIFQVDDFRAPTEPPKTTRTTQEPPETSRTPQEPPETSRTTQEPPETTRNPQEPPETSRTTTQETTQEVVYLCEW